jgi:thioredoxin reductase
VILVGGGPFGLMLAIELGRRRIDVLLVDEKPGTTQNEAYEADLALIRPDQIVGWRGNDDRAADSILQRLTGRA